jgi:hypothetical protein
VIKIQDIKFPIRHERGETLHVANARWVLRDANNQRLGALYDMDANVALLQVQLLNQYGRNLVKAQSSTVEASGAPEFVEASFPAWMGQYPRYGTQWNDTEKAVLKQRWLEGFLVHKIAKAHGRDTASIIGNLEKMFGANYQDFHGASTKQTERLAMITKLGEQLLKLMVEAADFNDHTTSVF